MQVYPSVMTHTLMSHFHLNGAGLGNLAAAFFYAYMITQIFVGYLLDRFSLRLFCTAAIFVSAIGLFVFGWTDFYSIAFLGRFLMGIGAAFATVCYMKCTSVWFEPKHYPFISSLLATSTMLGAAFGSAPLAYVVNSFGWRGSVMLLAAIGAVLGVLFLVFVKDRQSFHLQQESYSVSFSDIKKIITDKHNWLITFYSGLSFSPVAVFGGLWGNPFLQQKFHYSYTTSATLISMIFIGLAVGAPIFAYLSDRVGRRKPFMVFANAMALSCVTAVIYGSAHLPYWVVFSLLFLFGIGVGCFMLGFVIGKERNAIALTASVIALVNAGDALFGAFTEPMIGKFLDMSHGAIKQGGAIIFQLHDYHLAFLVLPLYLLVATSLLFFIKTEKESMRIEADTLSVAAMAA
jgi:MFS family permease